MGSRSAGTWAARTGANKAAIEIAVRSGWRNGMSGLLAWSPDSSPIRGALPLGLHALSRGSPRSCAGLGRRRELRVATRGARDGDLDLAVLHIGHKRRAVRPSLAD